MFTIVIDYLCVLISNTVRYALERYDICSDRHDNNYKLIVRTYALSYLFIRNNTRSIRIGRNNNYKR